MIMYLKYSVNHRLHTYTEYVRFAGTRDTVQGTAPVVVKFCKKTKNRLIYISLSFM